MRHLFAAFCVTFLLLADFVSCAPVPKSGSAKVIQVIDGDTFTAEYKGKTESIRLIGIDAPESRPNAKARREQKRTGSDLETILDFGKRSTAFLRTLLEPGTSVRLEFDVTPRDRYDRLLCYVYLPDGRMINEELVKAGFALARSYPPNTKHQDDLRRAERDAERANRGLWASPP